MPEVIRFLVTAAGGATVGATIVFALSSWLGKVWANRILEQDRAHYRREVDSELHRLKDQLDRGQFIHKLQFETEFKAYIDLWEKVVVVYRAALQLRPLIDGPTPAGKSREDVMRERIDKLSAAFESLRLYYANLRPFLAPVVFFLSDNLADAVYEEAIEYQSTKFTDPGYWSKAQENAKKITGQAIKICDAIRERIGIIGLPDPMREPTESPKTA